MYEVIGRMCKELFDSALKHLEVGSQYFSKNYEINIENRKVICLELLKEGKEILEALLDIYKRTDLSNEDRELCWQHILEIREQNEKISKEHEKFLIQQNENTDKKIENNSNFAKHVVAAVLTGGLSIPVSIYESKNKLKDPNVIDVEKEHE